MLKKILKFTGITLLILLVAAVLVPVIFKGKIISMVKAQINKNINATVDFADVDISVFRHFPKLSVGLDSLRVIGVGDFAEDTLVAVQQLDVSLNLVSAIRGSELIIYGINLNQPRIHAIINKSGKANWDIVKPDTAAVKTQEESKPFSMQLEHYAINNGYVSYVDEVGKMSSTITNLNHSGSGDFSAAIFTLKTNTTADEVNVVYGGIPYLNKVRTSIDVDIAVDGATNKYTFNTEKIKLNELQLSSKGFFQLVDDSTYNMDIDFKAPSTDFRNILSFVPAIYKNNFASVKTSGQAVFNGLVKGTYSATQIPAYHINLEVKNGFFQYPDLPKSVQHINLLMKVDNPDGVTDHTVVNIPQGHMELGSDAFDFRLLVKNPVTDMFVDAAAKGQVDLSGITQFVKLEDGTKLTGLLNADATVSGKVNAIQKQQYDQFKAAGIIGLSNFLYASKDYPAGVALSNVLLTFNPKNVTLSNAAGSFMKTNFSANGYINNLLPYMLQGKPLDGVLDAKADYINLNDWMGVSTDSANKNAATSAPFAVPANLDLTVNAAVDKVHYDKLDIANLTGSLHIADEKVTMNNVKGNALDGTIEIGGYYSTKVSKRNPDIALTYHVTDVDIQKTFFAFNTMQKLMPVGKFLAGKLTSQLALSGKLGENMMPDLNTLSGVGNALLIEGFLSKFQPIEKLSQTLNVTALQNISAKDIKTYFEFANGKVLVKPFNVKVKGIDMEIGGLHGLNQSMDYTINMKLPRALMGSAGNALINNFAAQAAAKGIPVKVGDIVPIQIKMGGSVNNPTIKTDLKQSATSLAQDLKQQAATFVQAKADSSKKALKDTLTAAKNQVLQTAKNELTQKLLGTKDSTGGNKPEDIKKKLEESGKGLLKGLNPFGKKKE